MTEKIRKYMEEHRMILPGDTVLVGLSGGADSVCLLLVLLEICGSWQAEAASSAETCGESERGAGAVQLRAVHINHQLRGKEAELDEQFVKNLCETYRVPLDIYRYPVAEIAAEKGIGTEEAGRLVRHEAYRDCMKKHGAAAVALAHHANDRAETFLFHAARGTSLAGLAGIREKQPLEGSGGSIVRPLLCVTRGEIEAWLSARGQNWRTDATNSDESYRRNAIRHSVIPPLEEQVNTQAVKHMAEVCADLDEADRFLREEAAVRAGRYVRQLDREICVDASLAGQPSILQGYILLDVLEKAGGSRKDLGRTQVRQLQELFGMQTGKRLALPYDLCAVRGDKGIRIFRREDHPVPEGKEQDSIPAVPVTGAGTYFRNGWRFRVRILDIPEGGNAAGADNIPRKKYTKWLDYDKINGSLCIRGREKADWLVVNEQGGSKKLKAYLIEEKVPREEREDIPLLANGQQIFWVVGHRISEDAKITEKTRRIFEIAADRV